MCVWSYTSTPIYVFVALSNGHILIALCLLEYRNITCNVTPYQLVVTVRASLAATAIPSAFLIYCVAGFFSPRALFETSHMTASL
jgi:hypothetical protein